METAKKNACRGKNEAAKTKPGVALNIADRDKVDARMVKDETAELNLNPRSEKLFNNV